MLSEKPRQVDNDKHLHVLCQQENCSHKFWLSQFEGGARL